MSTLFACLINMILHLRRVLILLLISGAAQAVNVYYCSNVFQLSNNLPIQRSRDSFEVLKILRNAENKHRNYYENFVNDFLNQHLTENKISVEQLNIAISELAADYSPDRFDELMPLFARLKKTVHNIKLRDYHENDLIEAFTTYSFLVDAKVRMKFSLNELLLKIKDSEDFYLFQTNQDLTNQYTYRGRYLFTFAKPSELDLLDFIRARALGYHIIGVTNLDRLIFDGFSKQGSSFFSKHDGFHAKLALKNDQKFIKFNTTEQMSELLKDNQEFLLKIVNKIESTDQLRLQILQKIIVFHFDHELGLSLKYEIGKLLHSANKIQLNREFMNIISDVEFENYGSDYKRIIGELKTEELDHIFKELFKL